MNLKLEVVVVPVSDVDRAKKFYEEALGFRVDVDYSAAVYEKALGFRHRGAGVEVSEPFHFGPEGQTPGLDPGRANYNSFMSFSDPDGNGWLIQEVKVRAPGR